MTMNHSTIKEMPFRLNIAGGAQLLLALMIVLNGVFVGINDGVQQVIFHLVIWWNLW